MEGSTSVNSDHATTVIHAVTLLSHEPADDIYRNHWGLDRDTRDRTSSHVRGHRPGRGSRGRYLALLALLEAEMRGDGPVHKREMEYRPEDEADAAAVDVFVLWVDGMVEREGVEHDARYWVNRNGLAELIRRYPADSYGDSTAPGRRTHRRGRTRFPVV